MSVGTNAGHKDPDYYKKYYAANRERLIAKNKSWRTKNPERAKQINKNAYWLDVAKSKKNARDSYRRNLQKRLWTAAKRRAAAFGIEFDIEVSDVVIPDTCPVFGIKLFVGTKENRSNSPSIDRVDNSLGYVKGNVAVVSLKANRAKNNLTAGELRQLAAFYAGGP